MGATFPAERFAAFGEVGERERAALDALVHSSTRLPAGGVMRGGDARPELYLLREGWAVGSVDLPDGGRQIFEVHLPGDLMGAPALAVDGHVETLTAVTSVEVGVISLSALGDLFARAPRLGALLFLSAQEERVALMDRLTALGRLDAAGRLAWLLVHLHDRLATRSGAPGPSAFDLPMTQAQIGDVLGLTSVHVSRLMRRFDKAGWVRRRGRTVELTQPARLREAAALPQRVLRRDAAWLPASA